METNPAHLPGKRRPAAAKKAGDHPQPSAQPAPPPARPKRVFGTARSSNVAVAKPPQNPLPTKPGKPLMKPSWNGTKKPINVCFQEPGKEAQNDQKGMQGEGGGERTPTPMPLSATEAAAEETPYYSAEYCSKCRFDKLEMAAYWLAQIKIADSASNHSVAAAFFRLASDCHAQPFCSLQRELKHYVARNCSVASELQWSDLCAVYGLSKDKPSVDPCDIGKLDAVLVDEVGCGTLKDDCFEFDIIDGPLIDVEKEATELIAGDDAVTDEFVDVKPLSSNPCQPARRCEACVFKSMSASEENYGCRC